MAKKTFGFLAIIGLLVVGLAIIGLGWYTVSHFFPNAGTALATSVPSKNGVLKTSDTTPTLTFGCVDYYEKGTAVACDVFAYKIWDDKTGTWGSVLSDTDNQIEVDCEDKIEALINGTNYYTEKVTIDSVPCTENPRVGVEMVNYDTSPTIQVYCQDDGLLNSATNSEGLPANAVDTLTVKIYPSYHDGIKDAYFFVDLVGTNVDKVTSSAGVNIGKPNSMEHNGTAGRTTADEMYVFPLGDLGDQSIVEFTITVDVGASAYGALNGTVGIVDQNYYVAHNGNFVKGFENSDNTDVGQTHHAFDALFYSASS